MDTQPQDDLHLPLLDDPSLSRRRFLRGAAIAGGGLIAAGIAACAPAAGAPTWTFGPERRRKRVGRSLDGPERVTIGRAVRLRGHGHDPTRLERP